MPSSEHDPQILSALQQAATGQIAPAIEGIRPAAAAGDVRSKALMAFWLTQQGAPGDAAAAAREADDGGAIYIAQFVGQQLVGQPDPTLRAAGAELLSRSFAHPSAVDPYGQAQQLMAQGAGAEALDLLNAAVGPLPGPWRNRIEATANEAELRVEAIREAEARASAEANRAIEEMQQHAEASRRELESVKRLGVEVGEIAHDRAADYLTKGYGKEADTVHKRANIATVASILLAIGIAVAALVIATDLPANDKLSNTLEKAAFSVPLLVLNAYVARLAGQYREEALRWRHIKLQIQTANPFLGLLDEDQRKETLAVLATRFFPGQPMPLPDKAAEPSDVSGAIAAMLGPSKARDVPTTPEPPASGPPA